MSAGEPRRSGADQLRADRSPLMPATSMPGGVVSSSTGRRVSMTINSRLDAIVGSLGTGRPAFAEVFTSPTARPTEDGDGQVLELGIGAPSETTRLLREERNLLPPGVHPERLTDNQVEAAWDDAIEGGTVHTNIAKEIKVMALNSAPLTVTFFLQYSLVMATLFSVGHLGKVELAAVSLASMTASVTGFAVIQGLATCLDTLCAQAYGAGRPDLVGLYFQKCVLLILCLFIPIVAVWYRADLVLPYLVPVDEYRLIKLSTEYLRIIAFGIPGYTLFECGKRFLQAQGIYHASTLVLIIGAPINVILNYVLVWNERYGLGFHGAPVAVACTDWLLAILLLMYVLLVDGRKCWNGFTRRVFQDWEPLIQLAIPGVVMVESEFLAFEVMTLASAYFGTSALAAQTVLSSITSLAYQIPFALSCATSTRIANFIGAGLTDAAELATRASVLVAVAAACIDALALVILRYPIAQLFSNDADVIELSAAVMPLSAFMHLFDGLGCIFAGILRGQGRQKIGGYLNLVSYYGLGLPIGMVLAFSMNLQLRGLWLGITAGLGAIDVASVFVLKNSDWSRYVQKARERTIL